MIRVDEAVTEKLSEVAERVAHGEHVRVQLADGRAFVAVPIEEAEDAGEGLYTPEEWARVRERLIALRGKWADLRVSSDDLIRERRAEVAREREKWRF